MTARIFGAISAIVLFALSVSASICWFKGVRVNQKISCCVGRTCWSTLSSSGRTAFQWEWINPKRGTFNQGIKISHTSRSDLDADFLETTRVHSRYQWIHIGVSFYASGFSDSPFMRKSVTVPTWSIIVISIFYPAWWCRQVKGRWVRSCRDASGLCATCGYDLRESRNRCPECGSFNVSKATLLR